MADVTPKGDLRGFLVQERAMRGATVTATTQAGPRPGGAVPSGSYPLALVTTGVLDQAMSETKVVTLRGGAVDRATVRWNYTSTNPRQHDPPSAIAGFEFVSRSTTATAFRRPHVARRPSTGLPVAVVTQDSTEIACWYADRFGKWSSATIEDTDNESVGCIIPLASGRLVSIYTYQVDTAATQLRQAFSDDGGATWSNGTTECLKTPLAKASADYLRIRGVELNGLVSVILWEQDTADVLYQYVSSDEGANLELVETFSSSARACPDLVVHEGSICIAYVERDTAALAASDDVVYFRRIASASIPFSAASPVLVSQDYNTEWGIWSGTVYTSSECALLACDNGDLFLYGIDYDAAGSRETIFRFSTDGGETWAHQFASSHLTASAVVLVSGTASTTYMKDLAVAPERGRAVMLHRSVAAGTAHDDSLMASWLGGWSTVGMPEADTYPTRGSISGWDIMWIPLAEPDQMGWTKSTAGAPTAILGNGGLALSAAVLETITYFQTPTVTSEADGVHAEFALAASSGSGMAEFKISDGTDGFHLRVSVATGTITVRDVIAAADLVSQACDGDDLVAVRVAFDKASGAWNTNVGRVRVWVRTDGPYSGGAVNYGPRQDRSWTVVGAGVYTGLSSSNTITAARVEWGYLAAGGGTFKWFGHSFGAYCAGNIANSASGANRGHVLGSSLSPVHLAEGLRVHGVGGPTLAGNTWTINTDYEHPASALDPSTRPSPRVTWRSTTTASDQDITWTGLDLGWRAGDLLGILVLGANFATANLYRDTGAVNLVAALDFRVTGLGFTRSRGQIVPAAGGTNMTFPCSEGVLAGAHVDLGGGDVRKVATNHAGTWLSTGAPGGYPSTRLQLESYDSGDAASGTLALWMPGLFAITEAMQSTDTLMLRIPTQTVGESYFEIGTVLIGRVRIVRQYSFGRSVQWTPSYELTTSRSGARTGRALGPTRRAVEIAWDDAIDMSGIHTPGTAPDHYSIGYTGADAIAAPADTPRTLGGILADVDGATVPIAYLPRIKQFVTATGAAAPAIELDPNAFLYGRAMVETLRVDTVVGHELADPGELVRVGVVRIEEEL